MSCCVLFFSQVLPEAVKKKDDVDGSSTMNEVLKVAVSGARGTTEFRFKNECHKFR